MKFIENKAKVSPIADFSLILNNAPALLKSGLIRLLNTPIIGLQSVEICRSRLPVLLTIKTGIEKRTGLRRLPTLKR